MSDSTTLTPQPWTPRLAGLVVAIATFALMIATEPRLAIVWDEGYTLGREQRIRWWFQALHDPKAFAATWIPPTIELVQPDQVTAPGRFEIDSVKKLFSKRAMDWFWPFAREEPHGHPPFYAILGMVGDLLTPSQQVLPRARLGPMLLFSLTAGCLACFVAARWGMSPALATVSAWALQPHLFAHGHYATLDAIVTALWVLGLLAFVKAIAPIKHGPQWGWVLIFGVIAGWLADTKLTGWFLPIPIFVWTALARDRRGFMTLLVGGSIGLVTLYVFNPCWWHSPISGVMRFLQSNLTRGKTIPIPVLFLGRVIRTPVESLPWYNTIVWTVIASPIGFLLLGLGGVVGSIRRWKLEPILGLAVLSWGFLLALRALPHTPGHDGTRQILAAFGVMAIVVGAGVVEVARWSRRLTTVLVALAVTEAVLGLAVMMPVPLSYYSPIVGGLAGATKLGMEPTYFWDALNDEALAWLNTNTPADKRIQFATFPTSWLYLKQVGKLKPEILPGGATVPQFYVLQNRPGALSPLDHSLISRGRAAHVVSKLGVPLVWIYPYSQVETLLRGESP